MISSLADRIAKIDQYFRSHGHADTERERLYARVIKLNEEVGELCEAILTESDVLQRKKEKAIDLDAELADVIITTLLIAAMREKDIWRSVDEKLTKQMERFNLE
ncbi:MAG TPA: MazG nucleotide pyrophosphohydrolase domain-containing protein [Candidatus Paceibacterota bacterium]